MSSGVVLVVGATGVVGEAALHHFAAAIRYPTLLSTIKLRKAGFSACMDSQASLRHWIGILRERRPIP